MSNVRDYSQPVVSDQGSYSGCLYGCLFALAAMGAFVMCAGVGGYFFAANQIAKYTSETNVELPTVELDAAALSELENRVKTFSDAVKNDQVPAEDLVLTADELNALISKNENLRGRVYVTIDDGKVNGEVSFPTDSLPGGGGRYFNGSISLDVSMQGGVLVVTLADAEVQGEPVPKAVVDAMANENLAKELYNNPENARVMQQFESVAVQDNQIVLKVRRVRDTDRTITDQQDAEVPAESTDDATQLQTNEAEPSLN